MHRLPPSEEVDAYGSFALRPISPTIGADIDGIDLSVPLRVDDRAEIHRALLEWKVLVFHHQSVLPQDVHRFACEWGEPLDSSLLQSGSDGADVFYASGTQNYWHADDTYLKVPGIGSVLHIPEIPSIGGDTLFADMAAAYDNLGESLQAEIERLRAVHDCGPYAAATPAYRDHVAEIAGRFPPVEHPVVCTHPETNRKVLFVNSMWTTHLVDVEPGIASDLLLKLCLQATVPEYQCRIHWSPDQVVMWDNRVVQHYAVSDYSEPRLMIRTSISGDQVPR
jgi:taurine dioxygenase